MEEIAKIEFGNESVGIANEDSNVEAADIADFSVWNSMLDQNEPNH